jgi:hypothetical protein
MILWRVLDVAALAVCIIVVIEPCTDPILGAQMAAATLTHIMILRRVSSMAVPAVYRSDVVELCLIEADRIVTQIAPMTKLPVV